MQLFLNCSPDWHINCVSVFVLNVFSIDEILDFLADLFKTIY